MSHCSKCKAKLNSNLSQCKACGHFNVIADTPAGSGIWLEDVVREAEKRLASGPWDWTFGGGLYDDTMVLLGGIPGAGKSTLTMQWVGAWAKRYTHAHPAYITTEESLKQIAIRADRLEIRERIKLYTGADLHPDIAKGTSLVVLDSLQGLCGNNDLLQEETMSALKASAMKYHVPVIVTSHITKDELLAGRMTIQHLVDVTAMLYNEDDLRTLVALKSRIGPAFYETIFSMTEYGLHRVRCSRSGTKALDEPGKG